MSNDQILTIERSFNASPEVVFDAWTKPETLALWWGPEGVTTPVVELDVREGGEWTTTMHSEKMGNKVVSGVYKIIARPSRLVFTWGWSVNGERGHETEVEVLFEKSTNGTKMTMNQRVFTDVSDRDNHNMGWVSSFTCLEKALA